MPNVLIIANESEPVRKLSSELAQRGLSCFVIANEANQSRKTIKQIEEHSPSAILVDTDDVPIGSEIWNLAQRIKQERHISIIALISSKILDSFNFDLNIDDFVVKPWESNEVALRIKRALRQIDTVEGKELIKCGDLVIDISGCQVSLGSKLITLTFREYQLLKFLASNKERVFTREVLLDKVWGWDYYGGDRTVDVHIRRLRSKIEDSTHTFIETVRNIGYRLSENL